MPSRSSMSEGWSGSRDSHPRGCPSLRRPGLPFLGEPVARKWCLRRESHSHWRRSQRRASAVGLRKHGAASENRTRTGWFLKPVPLLLGYRGSGKWRPWPVSHRLGSSLRGWPFELLHAQGRGGPRGSFALNLRGKNPLLWTLSYRPMVASEGFAPSTSTL